MANNGETKAYEVPLSPAAQLFHTPNLNCHIIAVMGCKITINASVCMEGLKQTIINHPRFCSKLVIQGRRKKWVRTKVIVENHVVIPELDPRMENPDQFVEDYIAYMTTLPMDFSKPLWEVHVLNVKTLEAEATAIFKIHHSVGDGASLISLVLACTRKTSDPEALPTVPTKAPRERSSSPSSSGGCRLMMLWLLLMGIWSTMKFFCNTIVDATMFLATTLCFKDTQSPLKGGPGVEHAPKRFVHKTISLDDIKLIKNAMNMTVNDVIVGLTEAAFSRYLHQRYGDDKAKQNGRAKQESDNFLPKNIRLRAAVVVNLRPTTGIQALADMMANKSKVRWGNWIGYILLPFTISIQDDPLDYVRLAKSTVDRKKHSLEAIFTFAAAKSVLQAFGAKVSAFLVHRVLTNTTVLFSNVMGPVEEISFCGHPMTFLAPSIYGLPHALTIHYQSYMNKMTISAAADPNVIPDPHQLCQQFEDSLKLIKESAIKRGFIKDHGADALV